MTMKMIRIELSKDKLLSIPEAELRVRINGSQVRTVING